MKRVKRPLLGAVEAFWRLTFRLLGLVLRPGITRGTATGHDTVLVVATHPDDEVLGCPRAMLAHRAAGERVVVAFVTDGRRSRALGLSEDDMAARRRTEAAAAVAVLDVELRWIGAPEGAWTDAEVVPHLAEQLSEVAPSVIYAPSIVDDHAEHVRVARALALALGATTSRAEVRSYQVYVPLTPLLANLAFIAGATSDTVVERAQARYESQATAFDRARRLAAQSGALWRTPAPAEVFWSLPAAQYASLMPAPPPAPYRGLRERPFADGLAWLVGLRARRRLAVAQRRSTT